jgi:5-carboxymethyl-2-hydroxymuconate isomerase
VPHLILHFSANLGRPIDTRRLFGALHEQLAEIAGTEVDKFKSRALVCEDFLVGDGASERAFAHLDIRLLGGRSPEAKRKVAEAALALLQDHLLPSLGNLDWQITVDLLDLDETTYRKTAGGHSA